jgi:hypothetical protein
MQKNKKQISEEIMIAEGNGDAVENECITKWLTQLS